MNAARLPEARQRYPQWAAEEDAAMWRLRQAVANGNIPAGAKALADWIDTQALMLAYMEIEDTIPPTMN